MHEMGLMDATLRMVSRICEEEDVHHVEKIVLEVGELSGVLPRFLYECFEAIIEDTPFEHTKLEVEMVPGTLYCHDCGLEFHPEDLENMRCPDCLSTKLSPKSGVDFTIKEILAADD